MALPFQSAKTVLPSEVNMLSHTYPAPVVFQNKLYVFYNGSGNDGIWCTTFDGNAWSNATNVKKQVPNMNVFKGTSPACVVFGGTLCMFYQGSGHDGTWMTTFDGSTWTSAQSISNLINGQNFLEETSPSATVYGDSLHLFWNGSGNDGIWFTTFNGSKWAAQQNVSNHVFGIQVRKRTSPAVCTAYNKLYMFYQGSGQDGTWFTTLSPSGWSKVLSVSNVIGGQNYQDGTSPVATAIEGKVLLVWNGSGNDGLWYTVMQGDKGAPQTSLDKTIATSPPFEGTNAGVVTSVGRPWIFWPNGTRHLMYTTE